MILYNTTSTFQLGPFADWWFVSRITQKTDELLLQLRMTEQIQDLLLIIFHISKYDPL